MENNNKNEIIPYREEGKEIVKRIEHPEAEETSYYAHTDEYTETTYENTEYYAESTRSRTILFVVASLTTLGMGTYLGLNYLQQQEKEEVAEIKVTMVEENKTVDADKEELLSFYVNQSLGIDSKTPTEKSSELIELSEAVTTEKVVPEIPVVQEEKSIEEKPVLISEQVIALTVVKEEKAIVEKETTKVEPKVRKSRAVEYEPIKPRIFIVKEGDSLASIAQRFYGDTMGFERIVRANSKIKSSKTPLRLGQKIIIPRKDGKKRRRFIRVEKGDTLVSISKDIYQTRERISTIIRANYKIKNKGSILHLGQKVYIPRLEFN